MRCYFTQGNDVLMSCASADSGGKLRFTRQKMGSEREFLSARYPNCGWLQPQFEDGGFLPSYPSNPRKVSYEKPCSSRSLPSYLTQRSSPARCDQECVW